jgi:mannose/fructose/N-acetylgalactosamine-specific phosphotransferase system component IID
VWWRTFFLQSAWSYAFKQNLGFARLYRRVAPGSALGTGTLLEPFNTNPVTSCFVVPFLAGRDPGAAVGPDGAAATAAVDEFRQARAFLASSFAATGDRLVWYLLRPAAGLAAAGLAWLAQQAWVGAVALVLAYDAPQLALRASLWRAGESGAAPGAQLKRLTAWAERVRRMGLALAGFLLVAVPARGPGWGPVGVAQLLGSMGFAWMVLRRWPRAGTLLALAYLAAAVILNHGMPRVF